jgi:predicted RNA-binding protein with PIN domain
MTYYLDGYNVIGQANHISLADNNKVAALIELLQKYRKSGDHLVVIFDGQNKMVGFPMTEKLPGITIIHTSGNRSADDYIKEKVLTKKDKSNIILVTSDRDILFHAKKANVTTIGSAQFLTMFCNHDVVNEEKKSPTISDNHVNYWLNEFNQASE